MAIEAATDPTDEACGSPHPRLVIVAAIAENGIIGRDNALPWRLKTDLRRLRALTWGKPMIMGRKSWESIGRPLPGRDSIVLTRDPAFRASGARVVGSWDEAVRVARECASTMRADEMVAFGGADIFRMALPIADVLHLTVVAARPDGEVRFPDFDRGPFTETLREPHPAGPDDDYAFTFVDLVRRHVPVR